MFGKKNEKQRHDFNSGAARTMFVDDNGVLHEAIPINGKDGEIEVLRVMAEAFQAISDQLYVNVEAADKLRQKNNAVSDVAFEVTSSDIV